jgi:hypothetical protein
LSLIVAPSLTRVVHQCDWVMLLLKILTRLSSKFWQLKTARKRLVMATIGRERNTKETAYVSDLYHGPKGRDKKEEEREER